MKKFNIVIDFEKLNDPYCGLGQFCLNLGAELQKSKLAPFFWISEKAWNLFPNYSNKIKINKYAKKIPLLRPRCEVFHSTHQDSPYFPYGNKSKFILTIHDLNGLIEIQDASKKEKYKHDIQKKILRADAITYISKFTQSEVKKNFLIPDQVHEEVIYNGVCVGLEDEKIQESIKLPTKKKFIFSIGTVVPKKNFHTLIEMLPHLPEFELIIAGTLFHEYAKKIQKRVIELGLTDRVHLIGTIDEQTKIKLYKNCSAFVFPSLLEGFGLPVIESLTFGKPTIISKLTSLPEIGSFHCDYFENFEPANMAEKINQAITSSSLEKEKLRMEYAEKFSWEKSAQQYLFLYEKLLN